jgi:1-acyl-sn-glycerol-3-phosphate acyltransferase
MIRTTSRIILRLFGWKTTGSFPPGSKYVVVVAPHTSNWDFIIGQLFCLSAGIKARVMIKKELFYFPLGNILRALGGIPVDRQGGSDIIDQMISRFNSADSFILTITPEGTRKKVTEWKTGFYRIAAGANVPVLLGFLDYEKKIVGTADIFYLSSDPGEDMKKIKQFYADKVPKYPENFTT